MVIIFQGLESRVNGKEFHVPLYLKAVVEENGVAGQEKKKAVECCCGDSTSKNSH